MASQVASEFHGIGLPHQLYPTASDILNATVWFFVGISTLFDTLPGAILGFMFVKIVNRIPIRSTYIKAVGFGFFLWLFPFGFGLLMFSFVGAFVVGTFLIALLILVILDAVLFACVFDRLSAPSPAGRQGIHSLWMEANLTLPRVALLGSVVIGTMIVVVVRSLLQILPRIGSGLDAQVSVLALIGFLLFFIYGLTQTVGLLRRRKA
jgi:hypothetical protein